MRHLDLVNICKDAGYHGDQRRFVRTYCENRISYANAIKAYREGERIRKAGTFQCHCFTCKHEREAVEEILKEASDE